MRIVFVNNAYAWGGVKTWCLDMAKSFMEAGHQASIFGHDPVFINKALARGLTAQRHRSGFDFNPSAIAFYRNYFKDNGIDIVVVNVGKDLRTAGLAAWLCKIPVVHRIGAPRDIRVSLKTRLEARLLQPNYMCCSQFVLEQFQVNVPFTAKYNKIAIWPGTVIPDFADRPRGEVPHIITTSQLTKAKRHAELLEALAVLRGEGVAFRLTLAGDGPERRNLEQLVERQGLASCVRFVGFTTNVGDYLKNADIFVLPTICEPLGIALEEAMAHGLVPVARASGGVPEIWPEKHRDLLIDHESGASGFAAVLRRLLALPEGEFQNLRRAVHEHARSCFEQTGQFLKFYGWLEEIIASRKCG